MRLRPAAIATFLGLFLSLSAHAATYTVTNTNDSGPGSLRAALIAAQATADADEIHFQIGSGPQTIRPVTALPTVVWQVLIDGTTQPGYAGVPLIEIDGSNLTTNPEFGMMIGHPASLIRGLVINGFPRVAIWIGGTVSNCYIGLDPTGTAARPNGTAGIEALETAIIEDNVISGNNIGVRGRRYIARRNIVGLNASGTAAVPNGSGLSDPRLVGGEDPADANIIAGNLSSGITTADIRALVLNNYIGITPGGQIFGNGHAGVHVIWNARIIGNTIAGNNTGIRVGYQGRNVVISGNSMFGNRDFGIGFDNSYSGGIPPNDPLDSDSGTNDLQNFPVLTSAALINGTTRIQGTLHSTPNTQFNLEFYGSPECHASGHGEGKTPLGIRTVETDGSGNVAFTAFVVPQPQGSVITATATRLLVGTSVFSTCVPVEGPGVFSVTGAIPATEGQGLTFTISRNTAIGPAGVSFATSDIDAIAGLDYVAQSGTLAFADGELSKTVTVATIDDTLVEKAEVVRLTLSNATGGASIGGVSSWKVAINDNDRVTLAISNPTVVEGDGGTVDAVFTVTLSAAAEIPISVKLNPLNGTASASSDFVSVGGTLVFAPGETAKTFAVAVISDHTAENDEYFLLHGSSAHATGPATSMATIIDDDEVATISVTDVTVLEGAGSALVTFTASEPNTGYVEFRLVPVSASSPQDYTGTCCRRFFGGGTTATISIPIVDDSQVELDETFLVRLLAAGNGAQLGADTIATVTILNDDAGIGPATQEIAVGSSGGVRIDLGAPATAAGTILIEASNDAVSVPASLTVHPGDRGGVFEVRALTPGASAQITATLPPSLGGQTLSVSVSTYAAAKVVFSPASLSLIEGQTATVRATLEPAHTSPVTIDLETTGGVEAPSSFTIPAGGSGTFDVKALEQGGFAITATAPGSASNTSLLLGDVRATPDGPAILRLEPANGPTSGGTLVDIIGMKLRGDCVAIFGGVPARETTLISETKLQATTPSHAAGAVDVLISCGSDSSVFTNGFTYFAASPTVQNVMPRGGNVAGGTHVRIEGLNFRSGCWAFFDGTAARGVEVRSATELTAITPAHAAGEVAVAVKCTGSAADAITSKELVTSFEYVTAADPAAILEAAHPLFAAPGEQVTVTGLHFRATDRVLFDTTDATILDTAPDAHVVRVPELAPGKVAISLKGGSTLGPIFTILEPERPQITAIAPAQTTAHGEIVLQGKGFRPGYSFFVDGRKLAIVGESYTRLVARIPAGVAVGTYPIEITNAAGQLAAVGPTLRIVADGVTVRAVAPACGSNDGGTEVTIDGSGFTVGASVTFDGVAATQVTVVDATTLRAVTPAGVVGRPRIVVTNPGGAEGALTGGFVYESPFDPEGGCATRSRAARH